MAATAAAPTRTRLDEAFSIMPTNPMKRICPANKVIVLGSSNVGKTTLVHRLTSTKQSEFSPHTTAPAALIMGDYLERMAAVNGQQQLLKLHLWDTAGQSKFAALPNAYFRHARGAILVYDVTSRRSFREVLSTWLPQLEGLYSNSGSPFSVTLLATKCNVSSAHREVSREDGEWLAKIVNADHFFELSASSDAADQCFNAIADSVAASKTWTISPDVVAEALAQLRAAARKTAVIPTVAEPLRAVTVSLFPRTLTIATACSASSKLSLASSFHSSKLQSPSVHYAPEDFGVSTVSLLLRVDSGKHLALVCTSALLILMPVLLLFVLVVDNTDALSTLAAVERLGAACSSFLVIRI
ncbi:hypothetical protein PybrP1_012909 [[Pythium] brassicae (nom. inval.)]|nr:hypothetical protein PybrP1_012909 [[Pythium] brassicae (nom. inval.)]